MTFMKKLKNRKTGDKGSVNAVYTGANRGIWLIGIDEVGRGPLAGPVTVGAVALKIDGSTALTYKNLRKNLMEISGMLNGGMIKEYPMGVDSKKMKESDRDFWYKVIRTCVKNEDSFYVSVQSKSAKDIDQKGIAVCIADLVDLNIKKILNKIQKIDPNADLEDLQILLDGALKTRLQVGNQKTIIKGDEKEMVISLASVYAKVTRDIYMKKVSKNPKYSQYGFEIHKGYGTLNHRRAILKYGMSKEHRESFCKNSINNDFIG